LFFLLIQHIIYQHLIQAPLKGVPQITVIIVFNRLINILILYIFPDFGFIQADCVYVITTSPKTVTSKIPLQSAIFFEYDHCAFTFEGPYYG
jgi:hypothetical protein